MFAHVGQANSYYIHCDSKIAMHLVTGDFRPSSNYRLVSIARALYDEVAANTKLNIIYAKADAGDPGNELADAIARQQLPTRT